MSHRTSQAPTVRPETLGAPPVAHPLEADRLAIIPAWAERSPPRPPDEKPKTDEAD